jgi:putative oxidoreductase
MNMDMALALLRIFAGAVIAAHGAQKVFGAFGGPGMAGWTKGVTQMGFRPAPLWANAAAWGELAGGVMLALGLFTGVAAGILVVDMLVAIWKAHWPKFFVAKGGMEYALASAVIFGLFGLVGPGVYALDTPLRLVGWTTLLFAATLVVGLFGVWAGTRPETARVMHIRTAEDARRRRAA